MQSLYTGIEFCAIAYRKNSDMLINATSEYLAPLSSSLIKSQTRRCCLRQPLTMVHGTRRLHSKEFEAKSRLACAGVVDELRVTAQ